MNTFFAVFGRLRGHMRAVEYLAGGLLVAVGVLLVTNRLTVLASFFSKLFPGLTRIG